MLSLHSRTITLFPTSKFQASGCTAWFVSDLVRNSKDRFCCHKAQFIWTFLSLCHKICANLTRDVRKRIFAYAKTKTQIRFAVTAKLISAFVFATWIVHSLFFLNPKIQACSNLLWLYSPVCVGPGRKPRRPVF